MKIKPFLILPFVVLSMAACSSNNNQSDISVDADKSWLVTSPDEGLSFKLKLSYGKLTYNVSKKGETIVKDSTLGFATSAFDMTALKFVKEISTTDIDLNYKNLSGKKSKVSTKYNDSIITFKENGFYIDFSIRMFNDGYGFRYSIRDLNDGVGTIDWVDENTYFNMPSSTVAYALKYVSNTTPIAGSTDEYYAYEGQYETYRYSQMGGNTYVYPILLKISDDTYTLMNEVDLVGSGYHGSMLTKKDNGFKTVHSKNSGTNPGKTISYPFQTPWRMGSVGTLKECFASSVYEDMIGNVEYWKPDNYASLSPEEQEIYKYDWVDAGSGLWNYLIHRAEYQSNFEWQKQYVDLCVNMGWKWLILDAGWNNSQPDWRFSFARMKEFTAYCHSKGIKVMCWANMFSTFNGREQSQLSLDTWKDLGIDGVKIDFWDGQGEDALSKKSKMESKETIQKYEEFYQEAAKRQIVVDCHGCNKPTSERRIYPNVINREAVEGEEFPSRKPSNNIYLSLVRCVVGPADFTPATKPLPGFQTNLTVCNNMALAVQLESGIPTFSGEISDYWDVNKGEITTIGKFYKDLPSFWDESILLDYSLDNDLSLYSAVARRKGDTWYVGGSSNGVRNQTIDFSFLEDGQYVLETWTDSDNKNIANYEEAVITKNSSKNIDIKVNGGFVMKISKK